MHAIILGYTSRVGGHAYIEPLIGYYHVQSSILFEFDLPADVEGPNHFRVDAGAANHAIAAIAFAAAHLLADVQLHAKHSEGRAKSGDICGSGLSPIGLRPCDTFRPQFCVYAHAGYYVKPFTIAGERDNVLMFYVYGIPALRNFSDFLAALVVRQGGARTYARRHDFAAAA